MIRVIILVLLFLTAPLGVFMIYDYIQENKIKIIHQKLTDNIVKLRIHEDLPNGGTGFFVKTSNGVYIVTNRHICLESKDNLNLYVELEENRYSRNKIIEISKKNDLCLLEALQHKTYLKVAKSVEKNQIIYVKGYPYLESPVFSKGYVVNFEKTNYPLNSKAFDECKKYNGQEKTIFFFLGEIKVCELTNNTFKLSNYVYPGNSGSPVVDEDANVVGVIFLADTKTNFGYAVTLDDLKDFLKNY